MLHRHVGLAAALLLLAFGASTAPARTNSSSDGRIVFARGDASGRYSLYTVSPATHGLRRVTHGCGWDWFPAWSPDGRRIAFSRACGGSLDLYVVAANGKGLRRLVHTRTHEEWPTWSPDGSKIAFVSGEPEAIQPGQKGVDPELWVVGANGRGLKRLTNNDAVDTSPAWSPDGKSIVFNSKRGARSGLWMISARGGRAHWLGIVGGEPAWSPDGTHFAYAHRRHGVSAETVDVFVANVDGSGVRRLTHARVGVVNHHPSWSPNGRSIVYMGARGALFTVGVNGGGARQLTRTPMEDADPDW